MDDAETTTAFAGLDGRTDRELPTWFATEHDDPETVPFSRAIRQLPRATETEVAFKNPYSDEWVSTDRFNALVEPEQLMTASDGQHNSVASFLILCDIVY